MLTRQVETLPWSPAPAHSGLKLLGQGREMVFPRNTVTENGEKVSPYLLSQPRTLREVCHAKGGDDHGRRCPSCCVREFCETQAGRTSYGD